MSHRIPTLGRLLLACTCAGITLPAVAGADNGGTPAPTPGGAGTVDPSFVLVAPGSLYLGGSLQVSGAAAGRGEPDGGPADARCVRAVAIGRHDVR